MEPKYITKSKVVDAINKHSVSARHRVCLQADSKILIDYDSARVQFQNPNLGRCQFYQNHVLWKYYCPRPDWYSTILPMIRYPSLNVSEPLAGVYAWWQSRVITPQP